MRVMYNHFRVCPEVTKEERHEKTVSTQKKTTLKRAWISQKDVDKERSQGSCAPPRKRQSNPVSVIYEIYVCAEKEL